MWLVCYVVAELFQQVVAVFVSVNLWLMHFMNLWLAFVMILLLDCVLLSCGWSISFASTCFYFMNSNQCALFLFSQLNCPTGISLMGNFGHFCEFVS